MFIDFYGKIFGWPNIFLYLCCIKLTKKNTMNKETLNQKITQLQQEFELKKDGTPKKDNNKRQAWQSNDVSMVSV